MEFKNYWHAFTGGNISGGGLQTDMLRGGPSMKMPGSGNLHGGFSTDNRKKLIFDAFAGGSRGFEKNSRSLNSEIELTYKPTNYLVLEFSPGISKSFNQLQYVTTLKVDDKDKYIFASINRETISASFRVNLNLSPNLTLQYWGQPFIATGEYYDHKYILDPKAENYEDRFWTYTEDQIKLIDNKYYVDENLDGTTDYSFSKRDFNVQEFLSNLVIRWEYNPGSSVYLVWSQTRSSYNDTGNLNLSHDLENLFDTENNTPHNVFLIKFSYRFGIK